jgi:lysophospholipase L1-like esterase
MTAAPVPLTETDDPYCAWPPGWRDRILASRWRRLVAVGDSVALGIREPVPGYRDLDGIGRVAQALSEVHPDAFYRNFGQRDLRTAEIRRNQSEAALSARPDVVIVSAGGNDALARSFDERVFTDEFRLLIEPFAASGALLVTMGLFDLARSGLVPEPHASRMAERFDLLDSLTAEICRSYQGVHLDNHHHPCSGDRSIYASDGIHANVRGHAIAAATLVRALWPA